MKPIILLNLLTLAVSPSYYSVRYIADSYALNEGEDYFVSNQNKTYNSELDLYSFTGTITNSDKTYIIINSFYLSDADTNVYDFGNCIYRTSKDTNKNSLMRPGETMDYNVVSNLDHSAVTTYLTGFYISDFMSDFEYELKDNALRLDSSKETMSLKFTTNLSKDHYYSFIFEYEIAGVTYADVDYYYPSNSSFSIDFDVAEGTKTSDVTIKNIYAIEGGDADSYSYGRGIISILFEIIMICLMCAPFIGGIVVAIVFGTRRKRRRKAAAAAARNQKKK